MENSNQKVFLQNPLVPDNKWEFELGKIKKRSVSDLLKSLINSGQIAGDENDWRISYQGEILDENIPFHDQVNFNSTEIRFEIHPIVAGASY